MACNTKCNNVKSTLYAVDTDSQVLTAGGAISFGTNLVSSGTSIYHAADSSVVVLQKQGIYKVTTNFDILATSAGATTVQLKNSGNAFNGAEATYTADGTGIEHVSITALVPVSCSCKCVSNAVNLTATLSVAGAVSNAAIIVEKLI